MPRLVILISCLHMMAGFTYMECQRYPRLVIPADLAAKAAQYDQIDAVRVAMMQGKGL